MDEDIELHWDGVWIIRGMATKAEISRHGDLADAIEEAGGAIVLSAEADERQRLHGLD